MGIMNNMRDYTKTILIILVLAFVGTIIFDWGMQFTGLKKKQGVIGKVDGVEISAIQFDQAFTSELQRYRNQTGTDVPDNRTSFIRDQIWESLVQDVILKEAFKENKISAADDEIIYMLFNAPPAILQSNPSFQNDKKQFDMAKYQAALNDPNAAPQWKPVEDYLRQSIPYEKFQQRLMATARVTDDEIKDEYLNKNQNVTVKYIFIDPQKIKTDESQFTDDILKKYYDEHPDDYKQTEMRKIDYVTFSTVPTAKDSAAIYKEAQKIIKRLNNGENFSDLAEIYSDDPGSKDKGGDLGFFKKGTMVKSFEDAAFAAKPGEIIGPVKSTFGLHIIKVEDKRRVKGQKEIKARHILLKFTASGKTLNSARDDADYFASQAKETAFKELAKDFSVTVNTSNFFAQSSGFVPGLGMDKSASGFIFNNPVGSIGKVKETSQGYFVYRISEIQPEHIRPFAEVKESIKTTLKNEKQMELAGQKADELYKKIQDGLSLSKIAQEDSLDLKETTPFTREGYVTGIGRDAHFIGAAFALEKTNDISAPVKGTKGYYLLQLVSKSSFDEADYNKKKDQLKTQLLKQKQNQVFANWYARAKEKANIEDYRSQYYQ